MRYRPQPGPHPDDPRRPAAGGRGALFAAALVCIAACESSQLVHLASTSSLGLGDEALLARATGPGAPAPGAGGGAAPAQSIARSVL